MNNGNASYDKLLTMWRDEKKKREEGGRAENYSAKNYKKSLIIYSYYGTARGIDENFDYFFQCGDDIKFITKGWVNSSINKLTPVYF